MLRLIPALFSLFFLASVTNQSVEAVATIDIQNMNLPDLNQLKENPSFTWWSEFGNTLVVGGEYNRLISAGSTFQSLWPQMKRERLAIIVAGHRNELPEKTPIIAKSGRLILTTKTSSLLSDDHMKVMNLETNKVYVQSAIHNPSTEVLTPNQTTSAKSAMDDVDAVRWYSDVGTLTNWNRHISSVDIVSARDWFKTQFEMLNPSSVNLQKFSVNGRDAWNVIATFNESDKNDIYIIGGHYDSISEQTSRSAPGAEDNATGSAGVLELARVFASKKSDATLIFITFSGEEQGLIGSKAYVRNLPAATRARIKAVITMDMIGYSKDDSEDVLLETSQEFKSLSAQLARVSTLVPGLKYFTTFNPFGSDHMSFIDNSIPAILTIDNDWGDYPAYHRTSDTIDKVSRDMGTAILKMNAAALAIMIES